MAKAPVPHNVKTVRQFLGLTSFFRKFVKNFATRAAPLTMLLRDNARWVWGHEEMSAVTEIKQILTQRPVLAIYDPTLPTEVHTDASAIGLGAMLLQTKEGNKRVVAYYSRGTTPVERRYCAYDLETSKGNATTGKPGTLLSKARPTYRFNPAILRSS